LDFTTWGMETVSHNVVKGQSSSNLVRSGNSSSTAELVVKYALNFKGFFMARSYFNLSIGLII